VILQFRKKTRDEKESAMENTLDEPRLGTNPVARES